MKNRVGVYGGSFDPVHKGHVAIARAVFAQFELDEFYFIPAYHAPHKADIVPTSAFHRYAMLALATADDRNISVSLIEIDQPERPYSVQTIGRLQEQMPESEIFFVIGADSWEDIKTWREWETVLTMTNIVVMTRPGYRIETDHVTEPIRRRIIDLRNSAEDVRSQNTPAIYFSDAVEMNVSATGIREAVHSGRGGWQNEVPDEVANYIEKYQIYK